MLSKHDVKYRAYKESQKRKESLLEELNLFLDWWKDLTKNDEERFYLIAKPYNLKSGSKKIYKISHGKYIKIIDAERYLNQKGLRKIVSKFHEPIRKRNHHEEDKLQWVAEHCNRDIYLSKEDDDYFIERLEGDYSDVINSLLDEYAPTASMGLKMERKRELLEELDIKITLKRSNSDD